LIRRANHRHIFIVAKIKPAPEVRRGLFESDNTLSGNMLLSSPANAAAAAIRMG
jgi:hypothetical protein